MSCRFLVDSDLKQLIQDEIKHDGVQNATKTQIQQTTTAAVAAAATTALKTTISNPEINGKYRGQIEL